MTVVAPDAYTEWDLTILNEHDHDVACQANSEWHTTGDEPAAWVTYWKGNPGCVGCDSVGLLCTSCKDKVMLSNTLVIVCNECHTLLPGPIRNHMTRIEPLK